MDVAVSRIMVPTLDQVAFSDSNLGLLLGVRREGKGRGAEEEISRRGRIRERSRFCEVPAAGDDAGQNIGLGSAE